jgi:hypothetical protein
MSVFIQSISRFSTLTSASANAPVGIYIPSNASLRLVNVGYSFIDAAGIFNVNTDALTAMLLIVEGLVAINLTSISAMPPLPFANRVLAKFSINDVGPTMLGFLPQADSGTIADAGAGVSIILTTPTVIGTGGAQMYGTLFTAGTDLEQSQSGVASANVGSDLSGSATRGTETVNRSSGGVRL